ncbi:hypothetical protein AB5N19_08304 [Seiridium cardinale]
MAIHLQTYSRGAFSIANRRFCKSSTKTGNNGDAFDGGCSNHRIVPHSPWVWRSIALGFDSVETRKITERRRRATGPGDAHVSGDLSMQHIGGRRLSGSSGLRNALTGVVANMGKGGGQGSAWEWTGCWRRRGKPLIDDQACESKGRMDQV